MRTIIIISLFLFWSFLESAINEVLAQPFRFTYEQPKMGGPFQIIFYHNDTSDANRIARECFALTDTLNLIFSDYIEDSEINRLRDLAAKNDSAFADVSPALFDILQRASAAFNASDGMFDITIGPLSRLWRKSRKAGVFPTPQAIEAARQRTGWQYLQADTATQKARMLKTGMQLDLGGIAQGYVAQAVADRLRSRGVNMALVNASGDIVTVGMPPGTNGWTVGVNIPGQRVDLMSKRLEVHDVTVSTSGDAYQYLEHEGKRYSHIVDPHTGLGATNQRNVTIIAADGCTADWLATACCLLPRRKALAMVKAMNAEVLIGWVANGKTKFKSSPGFKRYWKP